MESVDKIRELNKILQKYKDGKKNLENRIIETEKWWKLRHGDSSGGEKHSTDSAWLCNVIMTKHADAMDAYPTCAILPHEPSDVAEAERLSSIVPVVLRQAGFEKTYSDVSWYKLKSGTGCYKVIWDGSKLNGLGDISIIKVNLLNLFWEPGVEDIQDSAYVFHVSLVDKDLLEAQYPQLEGKLSGQSDMQISEFTSDDTIDTTDKAMVVDCYRKFNGVLHYCKYVGENMLADTEQGLYPTTPTEDLTRNTPETTQDGLQTPGVAETPAAEESRRPMQIAQTASMPSATDVQAAQPNTSTPAMAKSMDAQSTMPGLYDHGEYPFVLDVLFPVEGSCCGYGYIDYGKQTQSYIDRLNDAILKNAMACAVPRWFIRQDGGINEEEYADFNNQIVHANGNLGDDSVRQIVQSPLNNIYESVLQGRITELKETLGNRDAATGGVTASVTSASGIASLQEAAGKLSRDSSKSSYRAFEKIVYLVIELIRQFYTTPRSFRITGDTGEMGFVTYTNEGLVPQSQGNAFGTDMGMRRPVFDIDVEAQKENPYTKESYNELAVQLWSIGVFNPEAANQAMAMLSLMDFKGKDKLIQQLQQNQMQYQSMMMGAMIPGMQSSAQPTMQSVPEETTGESEEHPFVQNARAQAQGSVQPR